MYAQISRDPRGYVKAAVNNFVSSLKTPEGWGRVTFGAETMVAGGGLASLGRAPVTLAPETTTLALDTATTWARAETLADHFVRHGADFGAQTADEYAKMASQFFQDSQRAGFPTKIDSRGIIRVFDPQSGSFGSFNANGTTRTFFKPTLPNYFDIQPGTLVP